jgi:hypothetical protein
MSKDSGVIGLVIKRTVFLLVMALATCSASAQTVSIVPVNIFGDGNPENGVEDGREQVMGGRGSAVGLADQRLNAGTIHCDGKIRGTGMVADTRGLSASLKGVVLVTAAHVLYDLEKNRRFRHCEFHFLALTELAGYRAKIDLKNVKMGGFNPIKATGDLGFGEGDWAYLYIPKPWRNYNPEETLGLRVFSVLEMESHLQSDGELSLIAYDSSARVISASRNCSVVESRHDDLGGGTWQGQLLDDCDSGGGASGGGIVAVMNGQQYLVGIRSGSHWSEQVFPASLYPAGPPDGSVWDRQTNTNFGRAIDTRLIHEFIEFIQELENKESLF